MQSARFTTLYTKTSWNQSLWTPAYLVCLAVCVLMVGACEQTLPNSQTAASEAVKSKLVIKEPAPTANPTTPKVTPTPEEEETTPDQQAELTNIIIDIVGHTLTTAEPTIVDLNKGAAFAFEVIGEFTHRVTTSSGEDDVIISELGLTDKTDISLSNSNLVCLQNSDSIQCNAMALGSYELRVYVGPRVFILSGEIKDPGITAIGITPAFNTVALEDEIKLEVIAFYGSGKQEIITPAATLKLTNPSSEVLALTGGPTAGYTIKAIGAGEETIEVSYLDFKGEWTMQVEGASLIGISIDTPLEQLTVTKEFTLKVWGDYSDAVRRDISDRVRWTILDQSLANVHSEGGSRFTAVAPGTTNFKASFAGVEAGIDLSLVSGVNISSISVVPSLAVIAMAAPFQFIARGKNGSTFVDVSSQVSWSVQDKSVLTISSTGLATPIKLGLTSVTATYKNLPAITVAARVIDPQPVSIRVVPVVADPDDLPDEGAAFNLACGSSPHEFKAMAMLTDGSEVDLTASSDLTWASTNTDHISLATVAAAPGRFVSTKEGTVSITATYVNPNTNATLLGSLNLVVQQGPQIDLEITADKNERAIGYNFSFAASTVHTCNRKVPIGSHLVTWQVTPALTDPSIFVFDSSQAGLARTSGDIVTPVDVQVQGVYTNTAGNAFSATKTVRVLRKALASLVLAGPLVNLVTDVGYVFDEGVAASLDVEGTYSNGMQGSYSDLLADGYTFTWTIGSTAVFDVDATTLAIQTGDLGATTVKVSYAPAAPAPTIASNVIKTRVVRACAAPGIRTSDLYYCYQLSAPGDSCANTCSLSGLSFDSDATVGIGSGTAVVGASGAEGCRVAAAAMVGGVNNIIAYDSFLAISTASAGQALGCFLNGSAAMRIINIPTNATAFEAGMRRICGCM